MWHNIFLSKGLIFPDEIYFSVRGTACFTFPKQEVIQRNVELYRILAGCLNKYGTKLNRSQHMSNSTQVITDTDIDIKNMQIIITNRKGITPTHSTYLTKQRCKHYHQQLFNGGIEVHVLDNANISLYMENSTFTTARISIQSEEKHSMPPCPYSVLSLFWTYSWRQFTFYQH